MFTITDNWIMSCSTSPVVGSWTTRQFKALGFLGRPSRGWRQWLVGREITDEQRQGFEYGSFRPPYDDEFESVIDRDRT